MERFPKRILKTTIFTSLLLSGACLAGAQPSPSPGFPAKGEKPEFNFDSRKGDDSRKADDARREAAAMKAASASKKTSSSSKSRSAEIRSLAFSDSSLRANRPLIISQKQTGKTRDQLRMDLLVMCRILEKAAREQITEVHKAAGIDLVALSGANRSVRTMYLDNYGAVFTLNVRLPLRNQAAVEEPEVRESSNEEWEETRNELFGQKRKVKRIATGHRPQYDETDVQELKRELMDALKNAVNIRNLAAGEFVTIAVIGPNEFEGEVLQIETNHGDEPPRRVVVPNFEVMEDADMPSGNESMMILSVQKKDLDEASQKNLSTDDFAKLVSVTVY